MSILNEFDVSLLANTQRNIYMIEQFKKIDFYTDYNLRNKKIEYIYVDSVVKNGKNSRLYKSIVEMNEMLDIPNKDVRFALHADIIRQIYSAMNFRDYIKHLYRDVRFGTVDGIVGDRTRSGDGLRSVYYEFYS